MKMPLASIRKKMKTFTSSFTSTIKTISSPIYGGSDHLAEAQQLKAKEKQARFRKFPQTNQNTMAAGAAWGSKDETSVSVTTRCLPGLTGNRKALWETLLCLWIRPKPHRWLLPSTLSPGPTMSPVKIPHRHHQH